MYGDVGRLEHQEVWANAMLKELQGLENGGTAYFSRDTGRAKTIDRRGRMGVYYRTQRVGESEERQGLTIIVGNDCNLMPGVNIQHIETFTPTPAASSIKFWPQLPSKSIVVCVTSAGQALVL